MRVEVRVRGHDISGSAGLPDYRSKRHHANEVTPIEMASGGLVVVAEPRTSLWASNFTLVQPPWRFPWSTTTEDSRGGNSKCGARSTSFVGG